ANETSQDLNDGTFSPLAAPPLAGLMRRTKAAAGRAGGGAVPQRVHVRAIEKGGGGIRRAPARLDAPRVCQRLRAKAARAPRGAQSAHAAGVPEVAPPCFSRATLRGPSFAGSPMTRRAPQRGRLRASAAPSSSSRTVRRW